MSDEGHKPRGRSDQDRLRILERDMRKVARLQQHLREKFTVLHEAMNRMNDAVQSAAPFDYPDELKPVTKLEGGRADVVFLSFAGLNLGMGMPPFEFLRSLSRRDTPGYLIKDFHQSWYQQGLLGLSRDLRETRQVLARLLEPHQNARLVTVGASSGGYAAIVFGCWLGARRIVAFAPQTRITKRIVAQYAALDTPEATEFLKSGGGVLDLRPFLEALPSPPEITVYYGRDHPKDADEALHLEGLAGVTLVPVDGVEGHSVTAALKGRGELDAILDRLIS